MKKTLLALGLAATLGGSVLPATGASAAEQADPSVTDSASATRWKLVDTSSDIDGDGTIDGVQIRKKSKKVCQVRVILGPKHRVKRSLRSQDPNPCRYAGSALFDNHKGAEVKVMVGMGAHTPWDQVLTYRDGKLVKQMDPEGELWTIDSTVMYAEGYKRVVNKHGKVRLRHDFVSRHGKVWKGNRKVLGYQHGQWVQLRKKHITRTTKQANRLAGWHVRGFKRWM